MTRKDFITYAGVGVLSAIVTMLIIGCGLLFLLQHKPEALASLRAVLEAPVGQAQLYQEPVTSESKIISVVKKANPAVVAITVSKNVPVYEQYYQESPFGDLFGDSFFFMVPQLRQNGTELQEVGGGSGFLISQDGYIVTNRHVVNDTTAEYTVFTNDGNKFPARVIARDEVLDIAIIKIEGEGFEHLSFADSDKVEVGQSVVAIGNALAEFRNTVSVGVVSGLSRSIVASDRQGRAESLDQLIQTDAAINAGNSGGPLLDLHGDVIGVNVAIVDGAQNVGFALSSNSVRTVVESVQENGSIIRPYLGVRYIPITEELQERNRLSVSQGALVRRGATDEDLAVIPGSPADKAGIVENDIILEIDGVALDETHDLSNILRTKKVGDMLELLVLSKGSQRSVTLMLEAQPEF
jgi:serine protease Do